VFSYDFDRPALVPGDLLGQDGWKSAVLDERPSLVVGPGVGVNSTQVAGAASSGDRAYYRPFRWCREWLQITGPNRVVTEEFWLCATTPPDTELYMGATWAPENNSQFGLFGIYKGKWYVRQVGGNATEYYSDAGVKAGHWYDVKLRIDFAVSGGSATLYHRDVTARETAFTSEGILRGIDMHIPMVPWGPPEGRYEISGIGARTIGHGASGPFYLDNFTIKISQDGEDKPIQASNMPTRLNAAPRGGP
jgi:hypothetical protein